jgi:hypothetical protein
VREAAAPELPLPPLLLDGAAEAGGDDDPPERFDGATRDGADAGADDCDDGCAAG